MKITANRRDDIIKQRDAYEAEYNANKAVYDKQLDDFRHAESEVLEDVQAKVRSALSGVTDGADLDIYARREWLTRSDATNISIRVECNQRHKFDKDIGLAWDWSVKINDEGEIIKDSGSWSGLQACTAAQLDDLQRSLNIMKALNDMDWGVLLSADLPRYEDYIPAKYPSRHNRPNFEQMLFDIDVEEAVGKPVLLKGAGDYRNTWFAVLKQTEKQYTVARVPNYAISDPQHLAGRTVPELISWASNYPMRVMKTKFATMVANPIVRWEE